MITGRHYLLFYAVFLVLACPAYAFDLSDRIQFHGFGGWAYTQTDENTYLDGNEDGNYDNFQFSLSVAANPAEDLRIVAQAFWDEKSDCLRIGIFGDGNIACPCVGGGGAPGSFGELVSKRNRAH